MLTSQPTVLLITHDASLCSAIRTTLTVGKSSCHVAAVASFAAARHTVANFSPDVIVLEESSLHSGSGSDNAQNTTLADAVTTLAGFAPVVLLGKEKPLASLSSLIAAGVVDFVNHGDPPFSAVTACIEKRLRATRRLDREFLERRSENSLMEAAQSEAFGEILRHELNNPLTGILGNAELLLSEIRRHKATQLSETGVKRLETVAALAVRMRETVRRLSQAYDSRAEHARSL